MKTKEYLFMFNKNKENNLCYFTSKKFFVIIQFTNKTVLVVSMVKAKEMLFIHQKIPGDSPKYSDIERSLTS